MTSSKDASLGMTLALSATFLFSCKPILIKWLYSIGMSSMPLLGLRMLLSLPAYLIIGLVLWQRMENKPQGKEILRAAAIGLLGYYLASYLDMLGLEYISAQLERIALYAYPTFVVILGTLFFGSQITRNMILALVLTYSGIGLIYGHDLQVGLRSGNPEDISLGTLIILGSALSFSLYVLFSKKSIKQLGSLFFTCVSMTSACLATFIHYGLSQGAQFPTMTTELWLGTVVLVIFATIIPTFMVSEAIKHIGPERVGISGTLGPVMTTLMAILFLGETFGWMIAVGMGLVIWGVRMLQKA